MKLFMRKFLQKKNKKGSKRECYAVGQRMFLKKISEGFVWWNYTGGDGMKWEEKGFFLKTFFIC